MNNQKQNFLNFLSIFIFFGLIMLVGYIMKENGHNIRKISTQDLILVILASYRITRIVVFEKIFKFARDLIKNQNRYYFFSTLEFIVTCPWCAGVWVVLITLIFFYLIPFGDLLVYALAIAGVASFIVQTVNLIGLHLEQKQHDKHN